MLLILVCTLISVGVSAQTISGKLIDEDSQPLPYANVVLLSLPDSVFVSGATSDDKGNFILKDLSFRSYLLQVSYIGYQPQSILLENLDRKINLGDIRLVQNAVALKGVTVTSSNVVEKIDRQIVIPSSRQIKAATSGYELLSHMQLPGLKVNSMERSISTVSGGRVQLRINDIEASTAQVQALRPDEVLRVEYIDNPDMQYANTDVDAVINYVVRRRESGVAGGFNLTNAVTTLSRTIFSVLPITITVRLFGRKAKTTSIVLQRKSIVPILLHWTCMERCRYPRNRNSCWMW